MSRYADIEPIIKKIKYSMEIGEIRGRIWFEMVLKDLEELPEVDAIPVVHGHWIQDGEPPMFSLTCSVCGQKYFNHYLQPHANYCSMCGAKMDESTQFNNSNALDALGEKVKE